MGSSGPGRRPAGYPASSPRAPCPHSGGTAPPRPVSPRPSFAGCAEAPRFAGLLGVKVAPKLCAELGGSPHPSRPLSAPSLLLSAGGSSSSMYSRFRCSSRSASCSFCLQVGSQRQSQFRAHFSASQKCSCRPLHLTPSLGAMCPGTTISSAIRATTLHDPHQVAPAPALPPPSVHVSPFHSPHAGPGTVIPCQPSTLNSLVPFPTQQPGISLECKSLLMKGNTS